MFKRNKDRHILKKTIKGIKHRDVYQDMNRCDPNIIPEIIPEEDCVRMVIDGKEIVLTYGQYAYIHVSGALIFGNI